MQAQWMEVHQIGISPMNERIKDLVIKTDIWCDENIFNSYAYNAAWEEKFAQLIVEECANVADENYIHRGSRTCGLAIKQHFGVEE